jgi:hypothetical protein
MFEGCAHYLFAVTLALIAVARPAAADSEREVWKDGGWTVAITERGGRSVGCHTYVDYQAGTRLVLMMTRNGEWSGALGEHGDLPDLQPGPVRLMVDGRVLFEGTVNRFGGGGIKFDALEDQTVQALSDGYQLEVLTPTDSRKLDLSGSENALAMVRKCVASIDEGNDPTTLDRTARPAERPPDASPSPRPQTVTGTAFLISDRYFLTNVHVAGRANRLVSHSPAVVAGLKQH